jgi:hypothetical protein
LLNSNASLESHLHILVEILVDFVTSAGVSSNGGLEEGAFRERSALLLSHVVNKLGH